MGRRRRRRRREKRNLIPNGQRIFSPEAWEWKKNPKTVITLWKGSWFALKSDNCCQDNFFFFEKEQQTIFWNEWPGWQYLSPNFMKKWINNFWKTQHQKSNWFWRPENWFRKNKNPSLHLPSHLFPSLWTIPFFGRENCPKNTSETKSLRLKRKK